MMGRVAREQSSGKAVWENLNEVRKVVRNVRSLKQILTMGIGNAGCTG